MKALFSSFLITTLLHLFLIPLKAQNKAPVAEDDFLITHALQTDTIYVLQNDFAYGGHDFKIFQASSPIFGTSAFNDSLVFYTSSMYRKGPDSLYYYIIDLETNQLSEMATIRIDVENYGFDYLDINNVNCRINAWGNLFWDMDQKACFEVPVNSGKNTIYNAALWMGGMDKDNLLHLAGDKYRTFGCDYHPGPWTHPTFFTLSNDIGWNRVWKLNRYEIEYHQHHWQEAKYEMPMNILEWPAHGNTLLAQANQLAPYFDWNDDGFYNPLQGDFPEIKGDQAIFFIYNDARDWHHETNGHPLGVEIQAMFYAFDVTDESPLYSTVFADYKVINRSALLYTDFYISYFADFDLGNYNDDYIGCDTLLNMAYVYNAGESDGIGNDGEYGLHPPAQGIVFLNQKMTHFTFYNSSGNYPTNDPWFAPDYYNYMQALWLDAAPLTYGAYGYGGTEAVDHAYPGNPSNSLGWSEVEALNPPDDRKCMLSSGPFNFYPGDTIKLELAFVYARDMDGDNLTSVDLLKEKVEQVREIYALAPGIDERDDTSLGVRLFPNPAKEYIQLETKGESTNLTFAFYNVFGKRLLQGKFNSSCSVPLISLAPGIYFIRLTDGNIATTKKIIKN